MDSLRQVLETFLSWLLLPPTLYGAGGAMLRATRTGRTWKQIGLETLGGVIVANMVGPLLSVHAPEHWHGSLYFLAGWGGLELVAWGYELAVRIAEVRIHKRLGGNQLRERVWNGAERRKQPTVATSAREEPHGRHER